MLQRGRLKPEMLLSEMLTIFTAFVREDYKSALEPAGTKRDVFFV